jgi:hypothetical protein
MGMIVAELQRMGFRVAASYLLDSQFVADVAKFVSGVLTCLSAMTALELPHVNVLSKYSRAPPLAASPASSHARPATGPALASLVPRGLTVLPTCVPAARPAVRCDLLPSRRSLEDFLEADTEALGHMLHRGTSPHFYRLNTAICGLIDEWNMVQFLPLDPKDSDTIDLILAQIDNAIQYHEDVEPKGGDGPEAEDEGGGTFADEWAEMRGGDS